VIPLVTIATLRAREGREADVQSALQECQRQTHEETGCRLYALHRDESDARTFVMVEGWDSDEAFRAHGESPHLQVLLGRASELFDGPIDLVRLQPLAVGDTVKGEL
jgi:quinol monooxygenase YgiN